MAVKAKKPSKQARKEAEYAALMAAKKGATPSAAPPVDDTVYIAEPFPEPTSLGARPSGKGDDIAVLAVSPSPVAPEKPASPTVFDNIGLCFICRATSCGLGVSDGWKGINFYCEECGIETAKAYARVRNGKLNQVEAAAIEQAGNEAGQYMDSVGQTDLSKLTPAEFRSFCRRFLAGYINTARKTAKYNLAD